MKTRATIAFLSAALITGALAIMGGCGNESAEVATATMTSQETFVLGVLAKRCVRCHKSDADEGKLKLTEPSDLIPLINSTQIFDDILLYNRLILGKPDITAHNRTEILPTQAEMDSIRQYVIAHHPEAGAAPVAQ